MRTATLPISYEIKNTATTTASNTLKAICSTLISEGGFAPAGPSFLATNGATLRTSITTREPILAIRLKNAFESKENRMVLEAIGFSGYAEVKGVFFELVHIIAPSTVTGTFTSVHDKVSAVEFSTDVSVVSNGTEHVLNTQILPASNAGKVSTAGTTAVSDVRDPYHFLTQNFDSDASQYFVVFATSVSTAASASAQIEWQEIS